jgi:hypothetical protein
MSDAARKQAQADHDHNLGPANTNNWTANDRNTYEAERARLQEEANKRKP